MLAATVLALGSAVVHATWNLLVKSSDDRAMAAWGQLLVAGVLGAAGVLVVGAPGWEAAPYVAASAVIHLVYVEALVAAYGHGDFSFAYPLARGGGAVLAAVGSVLLLDDDLAPLAWVAIAIAASGLLATSRTSDAADGGRSRALAYAATTALAIATYTLVDSSGSRAVDSGLAYAMTLTATNAVAFSVNSLLRPARRAKVGTLRRTWGRSVVGGAASLAAYAMVLVAVRNAPVGYVTMLRESSVVIGPILGWLVLREPLGKRRIAPAALVVAGLVLLVIAET